MSVAQGWLSEVITTEAAKEVIPGAQSCHLACKLSNKHGLSSVGDSRAPSIPGFLTLYPDLDQAGL